MTRYTGSGGLLLALALTPALTAGAFVLALRQYQEVVAERQHAWQVLEALDDLLDAAQDAETGQRGYLLTHEAPYLKPYTEARGRALARCEDLRALTANDPGQAGRVELLARLLRDKLAELGRTVALADGGNHEAALEVVRTGEGLSLMEEIRAAVRACKDEAGREVAEKNQHAEDRARLTTGVVLVGNGLAALLGLAAAAVARHGPVAVPTSGDTGDVREVRG